jgi:integrase
VPEEVEVFTDDEVKRILKAAEGHRLEALWALAVGTGARQGELLALERDDFDLKAGTVRIVRMVDQRKGGFTVQAPKSKSGTRTITLPAFALEAVKKHLQDRAAGPVFTTTSGKYIARNNLVNQDWNPLLTRAKVPYRKFHTCRHTHASRLLADGVDTAEVAKRIGDKIDTLTKVYAHWIPTTNRDTAAKIDAIYRSGVA